MNPNSSYCSQPCHLCRHRHCQIRDPFLAEYSTHDLQNGMALHGDLAKRYAKYAWRDPTLNYALQDGTRAVRQGGMYARDAFEVTRRQARDAFFLVCLQVSIPLKQSIQDPENLARAADARPAVQA